jgi:pyruvate dehydrogenase E2 component (dihydrolipoamide acetyltransferase)
VGQAGEATPGKAADTGPIDLPGDRTPVLVPDVASPGGRVRATPAARARARSYGIDLVALRGTGVAGRIHVRDVETSRAVRTASSVVPASSATYRDIPVAGARKVIADRMSQSFHRSVPVLLTTEVVMDRARPAGSNRLDSMAWREAINPPGDQSQGMRCKGTGLNAH